MKHPMRARFVIRIFCCLLGVCMAAACVLCALRERPTETTQARSLQSVENEIKEQEALLSRLQSELDDLKNKLSETGNEVDALRREAELTGAQIAALEVKIELNESLLVSCEMELSTIQAELYLVENEYAYYQELFAELMRFVYENGTASDFELLFSSDGLSDYLERRDNFNSIMQCINDLQEASQRSKQHLSDLEREYTDAEAKYRSHLDELEADRAEAETKREQLEIQCSELNIDKSELNGEFASLNNTIAEAKQKLEKLKKEREAIIKEQQASVKPGVYPDFTQKNPTSGFIWPISKGVTYRITSNFGTRTNPITGHGTEYHEGLDIACAKGTPILAVKSGIVTKSAAYGGYGNCVIIYHGKDAAGRAVTTLYGHASALNCKEGQQVAQGEVIAYVGSTGRSTGNHLHLSVLLNGVYQDPDDYLPDGFYTKLPND